jgi:hypothetical protein
VVTHREIYPRKKGGLAMKVCFIVVVVQTKDGLTILIWI